MNIEIRTHTNTYVLYNAQENHAFVEWWFLIFQDEIWKINKWKRWYEYVDCPRFTSINLFIRFVSQLLFFCSNFKVHFSFYNYKSKFSIKSLNSLKFVNFVFIVLNFRNFWLKAKKKIEHNSANEKTSPLSFK